MTEKLMNVLSVLVVTILVFLAISSGVTKVLLMKQDVEFFGKYGFTNPILISYGAVQIFGGVLMIFRQTRFLGAAIVAVTFVVSLVVLLLEGDFPVSIVTAIATVLLLVVMKRAWRTQLAD